MILANFFVGDKKEKDRIKAVLWPPRRESNSQQKLRRFPLYPFNYREIFMFLKLFYDTKIPILYHNTARFERKAQYIAVYMATLCYI